jgi:hypothetical protein
MGRSAWREGGACAGRGGGGGRLVVGDVGPADGTGGTRLSDSSCDGSPEAKYEARLLGGWDGPDGVIAVSVISSPDSDPGPGERTCGGGGGTGRATSGQYELQYLEAMWLTR